jgi:organic radical activating enzyme
MTPFKKDMEIVATYQTLDDTLKRVLKRCGLYETARRLRRRYHKSLHHWAPLDYPGLKLTTRRWVNYALLRWEEGRGHTKLRAFPLVLVIETGNVCNLRCPACLTGAGQIGRRRSFFPMGLYRDLIHEIGDRVLMVELCNWGEPLLNENLEEMIALASAKGASTITSTHFSVNIDAARADRLVHSGLSVLGVSLDGATQETYEQYRVGGDLNRVLANVRLVREARERARSEFPRIVWEYHVFPHNMHEIESARSLAAELGMDFSLSKGWVNGPDPQPRGPYEITFTGSMPRCRFLWQRAVVHNDGGVAPCDGCFYKEDDFATMPTEPQLSAVELETRSFKQVWNNANFVAARELFHDPLHAAARDLICSVCPVTSMWHGYNKHIAAGRPAEAFDPGFTENDGHNFFVNRTKVFKGAELPVYDTKQRPPSAHP